MDIEHQKRLEAWHEMQSKEDELRSKYWCAHFEGAVCAVRHSISNATKDLLTLSAMMGNFGNCMIYSRKLSKEEMKPILDMLRNNLLRILEVITQVDMCSGDFREIQDALKNKNLGGLENE